MKIESIYIAAKSKFSTYVAEWAVSVGITTEEFDIKSQIDNKGLGLLLVNENHDLDKDLVDLYDLFDKKHVPSQKIDVNGTLQVAVSNFELWLNNNKCNKVIILGDDSLVKNENLDRFFSRIKKAKVTAS